MTTQFLFSNNASTTLASPLSSSATTMTVYPGQGALFPSPSSGQAFTVTLTSASTGISTEIVFCTARSGDTFTIVRGQEGTTAQAWAAGDYVNNFITAGTAATFVQSPNPLTAGTYGSSVQIPVISINSTGGITAISAANATTNTCQGSWNAATNTPTLTSSVGTPGYYYFVTVAGTTNLNGISTWNVGDQVIFGAGQWFRLIGNTTNVFGSLTVTGLSGLMYANGTSPISNATGGQIVSAIGNTPVAQTTAVNGGAANQIVVQSGAGATTFIPAPTTAGTYLYWGGASFLWATIGTGPGTTAQYLTFNSSGAGAGSGTFFNGGTAQTISYNTIGAPSTSGVGATGTWPIGITGNALTSSVASNLAAGIANTIPYQTGSNTTSFISAPTVSGTFLLWNGSGFVWAAAGGGGGGITSYALVANNSGSGDASGMSFNGSVLKTISYNTIGSPSVTGTNATGTWAISVTGSAATATTSNNIAGGAANQILYQSNSGATSFLSSPSVTGTVLTWNGTTFVWTAPSGTVANSVTFNNSGSGAATGSSFNGSSPLIISYNTIGAPSSTGANASGTWGISISGNSATATSASTAAVATSATTATTATSATNIAGGAANAIAVQNGTGSTSFIVQPSTANTYLEWNGSTFVWATVSSGSVANSVIFNNSGTGAASGVTFNGSTAQTISYNTLGAPSITGVNATGTWSISILGTAATASNIAAGTAGAILYQSSAGTTGFTSIGTSGQLLTSAGSGTPTWTSQSAITVGSANSIANSGGWSITPSGTKLYFNFNGTNVASLDSSGNFIALANVTAYGTP